MTTPDQKPNAKFPVQGISGIRFLTLFALFMGMLLFAGMASANLETSALLQFLRSVMFEVFAKVALTIVFTVVFSYILFTQVLDTTVVDLPKAFKKSRNDSHAYLLVGIMFSVIALVTQSRGATFDAYLSTFMIRGALAWTLAAVATSFVAFLFGVHSMDEFRDWIQTEDNDSYAVIVAGLIVGTTILAVSV